LQLPAVSPAPAPARFELDILVERAPARLAVVAHLVGAHAPQRRRVGVDGHGALAGGVADES
jgi:hypothetical protein